MTENNGEWLLDKVQSQLDSDWDDIRDLKAGAKGTHYERKLKKFLHQYYGNIYDIRTKTAVIDPDGECFDIFDFTGDDEYDVVASFKQSNPKIVFETGEEPEKIPWVPYISAAFIIEVKSSLTKQALEGDLEKLNKLTQLDPTIEDRFDLNMTGGYTIDQPLKCLVYDRESIAEETLNELLEDHLEDWHLVLIVEEDTIILNSRLPFAQSLIPASNKFGPAEIDESLPDEALDAIEDEFDFDTDPDILTTDRGLLNFITAIAVSIPDPLSISTIDTILSMTQGTTTASGAKKSVNNDDLDD